MRKGSSFRKGCRKAQLCGRMGSEMEKDHYMAVAKLEVASSTHTSHEWKKQAKAPRETRHSAQQGLAPKQCNQ